MTFERWYLDNFTSKDNTDRLYLPIQWTALYCNNGYGNAPILHTIQKFIDTLDRTKKYYTIVQYDDGILNNIAELDIVVCAMAGRRIDFSLPLLCTPHKFNFAKPVPKDIRASFVGSLTHVLRSNMIDQLSGKEDYHIETKHKELRDYCNIIRRSKYVLCPRGYGQSSFRIQEAIDLGAIPVYISDEFVFPYNMPSFPFGITIQADEYGTIPDIDQVLNYAEQTGVDKLASMMAQTNRNLFTYSGCKSEILNYLRSQLIWELE